MHNTALEQLFRRMVFNVLAWNCDDHVKNISFLMDRSGVWSLSPAYDVCYAHNPEGDWMSRHQMSVNGKRIGITCGDMLSCARFAGLRPSRAKRIIDEVSEAVRSWRRFAGLAEVSDYFTHRIASRLSDE